RRLPRAQPLALINQILGGDMGEVRMFLDRIESFAASLTESERQAPTFVRALDELTNDLPARERFLAFARDSDEPPLRARMIKLAHKLGWLSIEAEREELLRLAQDLLAGGRISSAAGDLGCSFN